MCKRNCDNSLRADTASQRFDMLFVYFLLEYIKHNYEFPILVHPNAYKFLCWNNNGGNGSMQINYKFLELNLNNHTSSEYS